MLDRVSRRRQNRSPETPQPPTYPAPRRRAAVVQFEAVHEECVPALVHLLRLNAVDPVVFLNERIRTNRPGLKARFPDVADRIKFVDISRRQDWARVAAKVQRLDPDLVVLNTFQ